MGRFINADIFVSTGQGLMGNNMFAYCGNNPVVRIEVGGYFWETVFDAVTLIASIVEVCAAPDDAMAWAGLAADAIDLIPFLTGVGEVTRAAKATSAIADTMDDVADVAKTVDKVDDVVDTSKAATKIHGNSLQTTKQTYGYALRKEGTGEIMKFGETTRGIYRYTKKYYNENGVYMEIMETGTKYEMHYWQHRQIIDYYNENGSLPPLNKSFW